MVVARPQWPLAMRMMRRSGARLIFDIYDPDTFATIEHYAERSPRRRRLMAAFSVDRLDEALRIGHHFICASERQLDFYLGAMLAEGLISPAAYERDGSFRSVIDVVPFGVPGRSAAGAAAGRGIRGGHSPRSPRTTRSSSGTAGSGTGSMPRPRSGASPRSPSGGRG